jgi:hypothetical protein
MNISIYNINETLFIINEQTYENIINIINDNIKKASNDKALIQKF